MKRLMVLVGIVASFAVGATIRSRSVQAQLGGNSVRIDRVHAIVYGENPPVPIHGEVVGFSCASKHDPKTIGEVECFIHTRYGGTGECPQPEQRTISSGREGYATWNIHVVRSGGRICHPRPLVLVPS